MAYTPVGWQTGDTITADRLNKMDNGWAVESSSQQLFTETVTTTVDPEYPDDPAWGNLAYSTLIAAETLTVTFDGTDYVCAKVDGEGSSAYGGLSDGAPDFSTIPFLIVSSEFMGNSVATAQGGTHTVSVLATSISIETSEQFQTAVSSCVDTSTMPMLCVSGVTTLSDMMRAYGSGRIMFFKAREQLYLTFLVTSFINEVVSFIPENQSITASFVNGVFTVTESV